MNEFLEEKKKIIFKTKKETKYRRVIQIPHIIDKVTTNTQIKIYLVNIDNILFFIRLRFQFSCLESSGLVFNCE